MRNWSRFCLFAFILAGGILHGGLAAQSSGPVFGQNDPTFITPLSTLSQITSLAAQADGKLILGGSLAFAGQPVVRPVARLLRDGALDESFQPQLSGLSGGARVTLQTDGKVLVWDNFTLEGGQRRATLRRLNPNGSDDASFHVLSEAINSGPIPTLHLVVPQADGRILVSGYFQTLRGVTRWHLARLLANGSIDPAFDPGTALTNGLPAISYPRLNSIYSIAAQPDNKVLVASWNFGLPFLARLNADGTRDPGFNPLFDDTGLIPVIVRHVAVQADGKILVSGKFSNYPSVSVVRLTASGKPDPAFVSPLRKKTKTIGGGPNGGGFTIFSETPISLGALLRADGKWIVPWVSKVNDFPALQSDSAPHAQPALNISLLEEDGQRDAAFVPGANVNGIAVFPEQPIAELVAAMQGGNALVVANNTNSLVRLLLTRPGNAAPEITGAPVSEVVQTNTTVKLTTSEQSPAPVSYQWQFNGLNLPGQTNRSLVISNANLLQGGVYRVVVSNSFGAVTSPDAMLELTGTPRGGLDASYAATGGVSAVLALADGGFIAGGAFTNFNGVNCGGLAKVTPDGQVDTNFCANAAGETSSITALAAGGNGAVLVGGWIKSAGGPDRLTVARLFANGQLDAGFALGAEAEGPTNRSIQSLARQADGKVLVGGYFFSFNGVARAGLARLNSDGSLELEPFAPHLVGLSKAFIGSNVFTNSVAALAAQTNGRILVGGGFTGLSEPSGISSGDAQLGYLRLYADGSLDGDYRPGFFYDLSQNNSNVRVRALALQRDGKALVAGNWIRAGAESLDYPWAIARFLPNGELDPGFNPSADLRVDNPFDFRVVLPVTRTMALATQPDGTILFSANFNTPLPKVVRLHADGSLESGLLVPGAEGQVANDIASLPDGRAVLAYNDAVKVLSRQVSLMRLQNPAPGGAAFTAGIQTAPGYSYVLEASDRLPATNWERGPVVTGDGTIKTLTGPASTGNARFYRLRVE